MRRAQISFSGAVDLNTFDLPAAVRRNNGNPFALEKEAYALGSLPHRRVSPIFDERNRPPPLPPEEEDPDFLPITEQPKPRRGIRGVMSSPSPDDESQSGRGTEKRGLLKLRPGMKVAKSVKEEEEEEEEKGGTARTGSKLNPFALAQMVAKAKRKLKPGEVIPIPEKPGKVQPVSVSWPGPDDQCAQSCILWCCCCVGQTKWPPKRTCFPDKTCREYFCPCCRVDLCCPCCVECCEKNSCRTCCASFGKYTRKECCSVCVDTVDDEEEAKNEDEKKKKDEKGKKDEKTKVETKGKS